MRNVFSARMWRRLIVGSLRVPIGSTRRTCEVICWPPVNDTVRAYGVPLRDSKLADTWMSYGNMYAPDALPVHSRFLMRVLISAFGSSVARKTCRPGIVKSFPVLAVFWAYGMSTCVDE